MKHYATVNEVKRDLPNILQRINDCKTMFDCGTIMLEDMQRWCVDECTHLNHDYGWWTTLKAYSETVKNQMQYLAEIEYLQGLLIKLPDYKNNII
jgi:hypothetical protein